MTYRKDLDAIKGLAIISVVLFHLGLLKSGYLGVDIFFVINGFLIIPSLWKHIQQGDFHYGNFLLKRMVRLMPLVVIATTVCLIVGFFGMLPDNYENLAESIIASNIYSENILSNLTTKNYWDVANDYKPLMHLWYVGILVEFYVIFPLIMMIWNQSIKKLKLHIDLLTNIFIGILIIISLGLYLSPQIPDSDKFYLLPYRFYELGIGGLIGINLSKIRQKKHITSPIFIICCLCLLFLVVWSSIFKFGLSPIKTSPIIGDSVPNDWSVLPKPILLLVTVLLTCMMLLFDNTSSKFINKVLYNRVSVWLGKMSFSIFVWHQILLAFYRYFYSNEITILFLSIYFIVVLLISIPSYYLIEQKIKLSWKSLWIFGGIAIVICGISGIIYLNAGVVRDVPEQNITLKDAHRGMHAEYCDRVYQYDTDYSTLPFSNKYNVLVVGISFGRDFANVLLESIYKDSINLSYSSTWNEKLINRVKQSDYIFSFSSKSDIPDYVWNNVNDNCSVWGIGTKSYGDCNGIVYRHRGDRGYKDYSVKINDGYLKLNDKWKREWGEKYIDFIRLAEIERGVVRVFTPEGKFISQDCRHLTKEGAQWYAIKINLEQIFNK